MRKRSVLILVLVVVCLVGVALLLKETRSATRHTSRTPVRAALRPLPPRAHADLPAVPRWLTPTDEASHSDAGVDLAYQAELARSLAATSTTLGNGITATVYATRARVPSGEPIELHMELANKDGSPLVGRGDTEILVTQDGQEPFKSGFRDDPDHPGEYLSDIIPKGTKQGPVDLIVNVTESGNPNDPVKTSGLALHIDYGTPSHMDGFPRGAWDGTNLLVDVDVVSDQAATASIRAELQDEAGNVLADATGSGDIQPGKTPIRLTFLGIQRPADGSRPNLWLAQPTLFLGDQWVDFSTTRAFVVFPAN